MFGSGVTIGMAIAITLRARKQILPDHHPVATALFAGVAGTILHRTAVLLLVTTTPRRSVTTMSASVLFASHSA